MSKEIIQRPWGVEDILQHKDGYKVKHITVLPNSRTSLQMHKYRNEYWIITEGNARINIGTESGVYGVAQHLYIPKNTIHRVENIGGVAMRFVEIQSGEYLGDDDITRFADDYGRV